MVNFIRLSFSWVVVVFGLIFNPVFAQTTSTPGYIYPDRGSAYSGCLFLFNNLWGGSSTIPGLNPDAKPCPTGNLSTACPLILTANGSSVSLSGQFRVTNNTSMDCSLGTTVPSNKGLTGAEFNSWLVSSGAQYFSSNSTSGIIVVFQYQDVQCNQRPNTYNLRAPGNGTGTVCDLGCQLEIAAGVISTNPLVVEYEGIYNGQYCTEGQFPSPLPYDPAQPLDDDGDGNPNATDPCVTDPLDQCTNGSATPTDPNFPQNSAGGGLTCNAPPACTGDSVQCAILYQTWASRCDSAGETPGDGTDNAEVVSTLNQLRTDVQASTTQLQSVNQSLNSANATLNNISNDLSNLNNNSLGINNNITALRQDLANSLENPFPDPDLSGLVGESTLTLDAVDDSGFGWSRSCPSFQNISFTLGSTSQTLDFSALNNTFCGLLNISGLLILAFAAYWSILILMGR